MVQKEAAPRHEAYTNFSQKGSCASAKLAFLTVSPPRWLFHACSFLKLTSQLHRLSCFLEKVQASHFCHTAQTCLLLSLSSLPASHWI